MAKAKKKRAKKYDDKLSINGSFEDVIKLSVQSKNMNSEFDTTINGIVIHFSRHFQGLEPAYTVAYKNVEGDRKETLIKKNDNWQLVDRNSSFVQIEKQIQEIINRNEG